MPVGRSGVVGLVTALIATMPCVRQYLDDSACAIGEAVAQQDERGRFESAVALDLQSRYPYGRFEDKTAPPSEADLALAA